MYLHFFKVLFRLLSGHLFRKQMFTRLTVCSLFSLYMSITPICNFIFSDMVLRAGLGFWLPHYLFVALFLFSLAE